MHKIQITIQATVYEDAYWADFSDFDAEEESFHPFFSTLVRNFNQVVPNDECKLVAPTVRKGSEILAASLHISFSLVEAFGYAFNMMQGGIFVRRLIKDSILEVYGPRTDFGGVKVEGLKAQIDEKLLHHDEHDRSISITGRPAPSRKRTIPQTLVFFAAFAVIFLLLVWREWYANSNIKNLELVVAEMEQNLLGENDQPVFTEYNCIQDNTNADPNFVLPEPKKSEPMVKIYPE